MGKYLLKRLVLGFIVILGTSIIIFVIARIIPGDVANIALGARATDAAKEALRENLYLNDPLPIQYFKWLRDALSGNFGYSFITKRAVSTDVVQFFPATFELVLIAGLMIFLGTFILGLISARFKDGWIDGLIRIVSYIGISIPAFVVGIMLILVFGYWIPIIPVLGRLSPGVIPPNRITGLFVLDAMLQGQFRVAWDAFLHLLLPAFSLAIGPIVQDARVLRSSLTENSSKEFMVVSKSHGLPTRTLYGKYLLRPSASSAVTVMGMDFSALLGQAFLVEQIFNWPGLSRYGMNAMLNKDLNAISAVVIIIGVIYFTINLLVDVIVAALDPRMRLGQGA